MKLLLKSERFLPENLKPYADTWIDVDTTHLRFGDYKPTSESIPDQPSITDRYVSKIVDDARMNTGRCKYCGEIIEKGHEEEHFAAKEAQTCTADKMNTSCFYNILSYIGSPTVTREPDPNNPEIIVETTIKTMKRKCIYNETESTCGNIDEKCQFNNCRKIGIEWFTPNNTFFLKHPDGLPDMIIKDINRNEWSVRIFTESINIEYYGRYNLKSYALTAFCAYDESKNICIEYFALHNNRNTYKFVYDKNQKLYIEISSPTGFKSKNQLISDGTKSSETTNENLNKIMSELFG